MHTDVSKTPLGRRWSSPEMARVAALALVKNCMNATRAAKELRPHLTEQSARKTGSRMIHTPEVIAELQKLTDEGGLSERNARVYINRLWQWMEKPNRAIDTGEKVSREEHRLAIVAATLLARRYLKELVEESSPEPGGITGIDPELVRALTGQD